MNKSYDSYLSAGIEKRYRNLETRIMEDVIRQIKKTGTITSSADYQLLRYYILGNSTKDIEDIIKKAVGDSFPETFELYDEVIEQYYTRAKKLYEHVNENFVPYEENQELQQLTSATICIISLDPWGLRLIWEAAVWFFRRWQTITMSILITPLLRSLPGHSIIIP